MHALDTSNPCHRHYFMFIYFMGLSRRLVGDEALASPSTKRPTVETRRNHSFRRNLTSTSKGSARHLLPTFSELTSTTNKKAHNRKEGTPSCRRRLKKCSNDTNYSSDEALYSKESELGLTYSPPSEPSFTTSACHFSFSHHIFFFAVTAGPR